MSTLTVLSNQLTIYLGITTLISGIIGGTLNLIVFLSLKTFRQSSCAFLLTMMSAVCIGQLSTGLLYYIMSTGFAYDVARMSMFYCKLRWYILQFSVLTTFTCISLAAVDQFFATCSRPQYRQYVCNLRFARRILLSFICLWLLHGIAYAIFYRTDGTACKPDSVAFSQYLNYFYLSILLCLLPMTVTVSFTIAAYRNLQQLTYRTVPIVRRELDKQLTSMVLVQVICMIIAVTPYSLLTIVLYQVGAISNPTIASALSLTKTLSVILYNCFFAVCNYR